jgi:hypothetical protein
VTSPRSRSVRARILLCSAAIAALGAQTLVAPATARAAAPRLPAAQGSTASTTASHYTFLGVQPDGWNPIRWNPCVRSITYKINLDGAPRSQLTAMLKAVATVKAATRLPLRYGGTTTVMPTLRSEADGSMVRNARADIVIAFARPGTGRGRTDILQNDNKSRGGIYWQSFTGPDGLGLRASAGVVVITWNHLAQPPAVRQAIYLHELAHAMGLGHVTDRSQLMYPQVSVRTFGRGDLAGLARVGARTGCLSSS